MKGLAITLILMSANLMMGAEPCSVSIYDNYVIKRHLDNERQLDDPQFINQLKEQLINQISSFVDSSVSISSSKKKKKRLRSSKTTNHNASVASLGILRDPLIQVCNGVVIMSIGKDQYEKTQYDYFKMKLKSNSQSLEQLLQLGYIEDMKFLNEQIEIFNAKLNEVSVMLPLVDLQYEEQEMLNSFTTNVSILKLKKTDIKYGRRKKMKDRLSGIKKGFNSAIDKVTNVN